MSSITRDSVTAVVVTRRSGERLDEVLEKVAQQTSAVDSVVIADASGGELLVPAGYRIVPVSGGVGDAVSAVLADDAAQLVWILRDDVVPAATALAALRAVLDASPSVAVVGPKQMDAERPAFIREFGESMSRTGIAVPLAEHELDQAQYDRSSDVLAVGEAGMLVRRAVWEQVGGFDSALAAADAALDFGLRVRAQGWRIEVVPAASVVVSHTATEAYLGEVSEARIAREEARAVTYRRLVHGSRSLLPLHALWLTFAAIVLTAGRLMRKAPHALAQLGGVLRAVASTSDIVRAQRQRGRAVVRRSAIARLIVSPADMRRRRALERDSERARREVHDDTPRLAFVPAGIWLGALALAIGSVLQSPWFGARALSGGGLRPLSATIGDLWVNVGATQSAVFADVHVAPDGFAAVLAVIGSLTWWEPNAALVAVLVLAVPLSFLSAWVGAGSVVTKPGLAVLIAGSWAFLPTMHTAISEGRIAAVIAHIVLPLVFRSLWGTTAVARGWLALTVAIVWVSTPILAPLLVVAVVARACARPLQPLVLLALVPALALEWPRLWESATSVSPLAYFADRGIPVVGTAADGMSLLSLWPMAPHLPFADAQLSLWIALAISGVLAVLAVLAIALTGSGRIAALVISASLALVAASQITTWSLTRIGESTAGVYVGSLLDITWWALLAGAALAIAQLPRLRAVTAGALTGVVVLSAIVPATAVLTGATTVDVSETRTLPAYIEAETARNPQGGTLVITPIDGGYRAQLERGSGNTLNSWSASAVTRTAESDAEIALAELAANLVVESGYDAAGPLAAAGIDFVVLNASPHDNAVSAINSHAALAPVGSTDSGVLWAVVGDSAATSFDPGHNWLYLVGVAGTVGVAVIAGIPTALPRRRAVDDDAPISEEEGDDDA